MSLIKLDDRIIIKEESAKYILKDCQTSQKNSRFKIYIKAEGETVSTSSIAKIYLPNDITEKVMEDTDSGKNIIYVDNEDELIRSLES